MEISAIAVGRNWFAFQITNILTQSSYKLQNPLLECCCTQNLYLLLESVAAFVIQARAQSSNSTEGKLHFQSQTDT